MGRLLVDVLRLKDEGLVGFTENGEQILLGDITLDVYEGRVLSPGIDVSLFFDERIQSILERTSNNAYIKIEKDSKDKNSLHYKFYNIRK
jgi:hypothetical protein